MASLNYGVTGRGEANTVATQYGRIGKEALNTVLRRHRYYLHHRRVTKSVVARDVHHRRFVLYVLIP